MCAQELKKVVDLPYLTVFSDDERPSKTTVLELSWHPDDVQVGRIRLSGTALSTFNLLSLQYPPATIVRAMFTNPALLKEVESTPGFERIPV